MVVETESAVYVFEFKLDGTVEEALAQIDSKGYLIPYSVTKDKNGNDKKLVKIGVSFDSEKRTLGEWKIVEKGGINNERIKRQQHHDIRGTAKYQKW